ncbi:hypothetical protein H312_00414 [Anncaliia algerae PRA339]|uniref:Uncharacterized protein n=1 Tax=Anncaliia algerae PRA339 TaxID=1288291 RepID=A0A059F4X4_9MICR|nr:hypothetical protein H312_00414 [Anncaliia algerae PRA339]
MYLLNIFMVTFVKSEQDINYLTYTINNTPLIKLLFSSQTLKNIEAYQNIPQINGLKQKLINANNSFIYNFIKQKQLNFKINAVIKLDELKEAIKNKEKELKNLLKSIRKKIRNLKSIRNKVEFIELTNELFKIIINCINEEKNFKELVASTIYKVKNNKNDKIIMNNKNYIVSLIKRRDKYNLNCFLVINDLDRVICKMINDDIIHELYKD